MKILKIYGVRHLMEWQCVIVQNGIKFHFAFTDGATTGYGVTPARYRTPNPVLQQVIEQSDYFKSGKIFLEKKIVLEKDPEIAPKTAEEKAEIKSATVIKVACLDDAKEYLSEQFGVSGTKMRSKDSILKAAEAHNIKFEGLD